MIISNQRYYNDYFAAIVRQAPVKRVVCIDYKKRNQRVKISPNVLTSVKGNFYLSMPYVFFEIIYLPIYGSKGNFAFNSLKVAFASSENPDRNTGFYLPPLGNIEKSFSVCFGNYHDHIPYSYKSPEELSKSVIGFFWQSVFTDGYHDAIYYDNRDYPQADWRTEIANPFVWQEKSKIKGWMPGYSDLIFTKPRVGVFNVSLPPL